MGQILTLTFLVLVCLIVGFKLWQANRRARKRREQARLEAEKRKAREKELLDRLGRLKEKDDLQSAKDAISRDPERAARVVAKMMRNKD